MLKTSTQCCLLPLCIVQGKTRTSVKETLLLNSVNLSENKLSETWLCTLLLRLIRELNEKLLTEIDYITWNSSEPPLLSALYYKLVQLYQPHSTNDIIEKKNCLNCTCEYLLLPFVYQVLAIHWARLQHCSETFCQ